MAIRMKTIVTMKTEADCPSHSVAHVTSRDTTFTIDEPVERGGTNAGPTPTETAISALVGCTNTIGNKCAASLDVDIGHLKMDATWTLDRRGVTLAEEIEVPFKTIDLTVTSFGPASQADLDRVATETAKYCPLAKLFQAAGTELKVTWTANHSRT